MRTSGSVVDAAWRWLLEAAEADIAAMEREFGVRLFNRTTRRVELTDAGRRYFERCAHLVDEARLVLRRKSAGQVVVAIFNLSSADAAWPEDQGTSGEVIFAANGAEPGRLPAFGTVLIRESN